MVGLERAGRSTFVLDAGVFSGVPENAMVGANMLTDGAAQRTAAAGLPRRHWRPYRGRLLQRQRFPGALRRAEVRFGNTDKLLMRLNFPCRAANG